MRNHYRESTIPVRHPDTIAGLEPDCRRVLRDAYQIIQSRIQTTPTVSDRDIPYHRPGNGGRYTATERREMLREARAHLAERLRESHRDVGSAIADYRETASLWGVDVG